MTEQAIRRDTTRAGTRPATVDAAGTRDRTALALSTILACQLMIVLDVTIVNIALPHMQRTLGFSATGLSWVITAYALTFGGLLLLGGRMGDVLGRRRVLIAGILVFIASSLLGGLATSAAWLVATRAAQGAGAALAAPNALSLLTLTFPAEPARSRVFGLYAAISASGASIGLILGGAIVSSVSWRWVMFVNVPIGLVVAALIAFAVREPATAPRAVGRFDLAGALTVTGGTSTLVYALVHAASDGWRNGLTLASFALSAALLAAFIAIESRVAQPVMPLRLFRNRDRVVSYVIRLALYAGFLGMFFFLTQFVQEVSGFSPFQTGVAFLPLTVAIFAASRLAPVLLPRLGMKVLTVGGVAMAAGGMAWLTRITAGSAYTADLLGPMVLTGFGAGFAFVTLTLLALADVAPSDAGAASAMVNVVQQIGGALGLALLVTVFGPASRHAAAHAPAGLDRVARAHYALAQALGNTFTGAAVLVGVALLAALVALSARSARRPQPA